MATTIFNKDPLASLDYSFSWVDWLSSGDSVATSEWVVPAGLTQVATGLAANVATIYLSGGTTGTTYIVKNKITTASATPVVDARSFKIRVTDR